ncbi:MAG: hypothetical protein ACXWCS_24260 [Burkholderiales bacterium]
MVALMIASGVAQAAESDAAAATPLERALAGEVRDEIGRQYWVRGGTATNQVFCDTKDFPRPACDGKFFGPQASERFTIEAANDAQPASRTEAWYRVRFDSGKVGYLNADTLRSQVFVEMRHRDTRPDTALPVYEIFFFERPEVALARMQQRMIERQADAARRDQERFDRGGIRVGMTKQQVLNSSWGQPDSIHTAIIGARLREQWMYGTNNLFFEEGVLTAVQTAR